MTNKSSSVIAILDWKKNDLKILDLDPEFCYGNVIWKDSNVLIGTMTKIEAYRLGIVYTTSKPTNIFQVTINQPKSLKILNEKIEGICCRSPRLNPDKSILIWLERDLNHRSHACCLRMKRLDLNIGNKQFLKIWKKKIAKKLFCSFPTEGAIPKTIVEEKELFQPGIDSFAGLNQRTRDLPKRCFINNHQIIFSDVVIDKLIPFIVNIDEINSVEQLYEWYSK